MAVGAGVGPTAMSASCGMIAASDTTKDVVMSNAKDASVLTRAMTLLKSTVSPRKILAMSLGGGPSGWTTLPVAAERTKLRMVLRETVTVSVTKPSRVLLYVPSGISKSTSPSRVSIFHERLSGKRDV